jgi:putative addiction module component (TIGR02574 family)
VSTTEIERSALQLPIEERLQLARRLVESIGDDDAAQAAIDEGVRRMEDLATGKVQGIELDEYLKRLK